MEDTKPYEESNLPAASRLEATEQSGEINMTGRFSQEINTSLDEKELGLPNPEDVLHQVVEAAEQNQAIEKLLERSHEVKDEATPIANTGLTSISTLMQSKADSMAANRFTTNVQTQQTSRLQHILHDNSLYAQAVRYGFVTAVCSLAVALLVTWLFT